MTLEWGSQATSLFPSYIDSSDRTTTAIPGAIYEGVYGVEGIEKIINPNWEQEAMNRITSDLTANGCEVVYFKSDGVGSITVQFKQPESTDPSAMAIPVIVGYIVYVIVVAVLAYWLLTIVAPQAIKVIGTSLIENPVVLYLGVGILALFLLREFNARRGGGYDDDEPRDRIIVINAGQPRYDDY